MANIDTYLLTAICVCVIASGYSVRICGNYCGPNWCNGQIIPERECVVDNTPDENVYAADMCCMHHDNCCGHGDRRTCNAAIIQCIFNPPNALLGMYDWIQHHLLDHIMCGTTNHTTYVIADFFEAMDIAVTVVYNTTACCGEVC